jgi:hypothetical protein
VRITRPNWDSPWHRHGMTPKGASNVTRLSDRGGLRLELDVTYDSLTSVLPRVGDDAFADMAAVLPTAAVASCAATEAIHHLIDDVRRRREGLSPLAPRTGPPTLIPWMSFDRCLARADIDTVREVGAVATRLAMTDGAHGLWRLADSCDRHEQERDAVEDQELEPPRA